jgi:hypothetical protein
MQARKSKYVPPVHIKMKQVLRRVKTVRLGRTIPNKDKLQNQVAKHVIKDIRVKIPTRTGKYVLPVNIKTKQVLLHVNPVRMERTIPNKDKLQNQVAKHVIKDIHVQTRTSKCVLPVHIKTKKVLTTLVKNVSQENMDLEKVKHLKVAHVLNVSQEKINLNQDVLHAMHVFQTSTPPMEVHAQTAHPEKYPQKAQQDVSI